MEFESIKQVASSLGQMSAVVVGLTQVAKNAAKIPDRLVPLVSLVIGGGAAYLWVSPDKWGVFLGVLAGLTASGLYSQSKTVAGK
jgi:hypothetical protein